MSSKIRSCALNLLARREHSKFELQQKLGKKNFAACDIDELVLKLTNQGLQNDSRFVEGYVNMRRRRGFGPVRIKQELHERGIDKEQGENFLNVGDPAWLVLAKATRCKKFGKNIPHDLHGRSQQMRYLYYKGFTSDHIKEIFNHEEDL